MNVLWGRARPAALAAALSLAAAVTAWGQYSEGYTEIVYDEFRDEVLAFATTYVDYNTLYYYDPVVYISLYRNGNIWIGDMLIVGATHGGYALASVSTPWAESSTYSAYSEHCVDAYYYYYEVNPYCYFSCYDWYDCYGYSLLSWAPAGSWQSWTWYPPFVEAYNYLGTYCLGPTSQQDVELEGPPVLEVRNGGQLLSQGQTVYISAGSGYSPPQMPPLTAQLVGASLVGTTTWKIHVTYEEAGRNDSDWFPGTSGTSLPSTSTWNINSSIGSNHRGGDATIHYRYNAQQERSFSFKIGGTNPSEGDAKTKLGSSPWFLTRIARQESSLRQFSGSSPLYHQDPAGTTGFGLMMITNPPATQQQIWSWWSNVEEGKARVNQKDAELTPVWHARRQQWIDWNQQNPNSPVGPPVPWQEGGCYLQWVGGGSGSEGNPSFRDASWIKRYNGLGAVQPRDFLIWQNTGPYEPDPRWEVYPSATLSGGSITYYVRAVCNQVP